MDPWRVGTEDSESLTWPKSIALLPVGNIVASLPHLLCHGLHVDIPREIGTISVQGLLEDGGPLLACDMGFNGLSGAIGIHLVKLERGSTLNIALKVMVGLVVPVIEGTTLVLDHTSEPVHVVDSSCCSDLGSISMASNGSHGDPLLVHEANDVVAHVLHLVAVMVVGLSLVTVVQEPDVPDLANLVAWSAEEWSEVGSWLNQLWKPDHSWQVWSASWDESTSEFDILAAGDNGLYRSDKC